MRPRTGLTGRGRTWNHARQPSIRGNRMMPPRFAAIPLVRNPHVNALASSEGARSVKRLLARGPTHLGRARHLSHDEPKGHQAVTSLPGHDDVATAGPCRCEPCLACDRDRTRCRDHQRLLPKRTRGAFLRVPRWTAPRRTLFPTPGHRQRTTAPPQSGCCPVGWGIPRWPFIGSPMESAQSHALLSWRRHAPGVSSVRGATCVTAITRSSGTRKYS